MQPQFPLYIVSKGRADSRLTVKTLEAQNTPYRIVIEEQEYNSYAAHVERNNILILDPNYQKNYDTCDDLGELKSKGPGPARNFVWDHAISEGHDWHWVMDDNIRLFYRMNRNKRIPMGDGTAFRVMEDFTLRYENVLMTGPNYKMFCASKQKYPPFVPNTRIYSCNLIKNSAPYRWRGRYNEDTDLSLRMLKDGYATIQFNAFLQNKITTQVVKGGNTKEFYAKEGTMEKSKMQVRLHPDVSKLKWRYGRWHHLVDYTPFKNNKLIRKKGLDIPEGINEYGLEIKKKDNGRQRRNRATTQTDV